MSTGNRKILTLIFQTVTPQMSVNKIERTFAQFGLCNLYGAGGMAEWSKAAVLKTVECNSSVGSNPTPSAIFVS
jgi:hypothetical protein